MSRPFWALVRKDLKVYFSNRRALLMSIVAPIVIASFFGYIFGGSGGQTEISRIRVLAVDSDGSAISREIVARLTSDKALDVKPSTLAAAREAVRKGKATAAIAIPPGFGDAAGKAFFRSAGKPEIGVLYDPSHSTESSMIQGMLAGHVMEAVSKEMFNGPTGRQSVKDSLAGIEGAEGMTPEVKKSLAEMLHGVEGYNLARASQAPGSDALDQGLTMPFQVKSEAVTSGTGILYNGYAHSFGGMGIQFILMMGIEQGVGMLLQQRRGVWKRLRAAPLSRGVLLGSRAASAAITSMFVLMVLFGFARVVFEVRVQGTWAGFLGVCLAFSLMAGAFGLLIAALGKTPEATRGLAIFATLIIVMLGGAWVPTFVFPQWLQKAALIMPARWAMDGLDATTWRGLGFSAAVGPIEALLGFTLVFGALAWMRFRWEVEG
jgi:ABC-2 type transport system permease protein